MAKNITFEMFRSMLLYHRVVEWNVTENYIVLDNGIKITIEMTDSDCCAYACGSFNKVELQAAITDVTQPKVEPWSDCDTYGCSAVVKMLHNQNLICEVNASADAGNGGYYFSVASFVVKVPDWDEVAYVYLVGSDDECQSDTN